MQRTIEIKSPAQQLVEARTGKDIETVLRELYTEQGLTQPQIAAQLEVSVATVMRWMKELGIKTRWIGPRKAAV